MFGPSAYPRRESSLSGRGGRTKGDYRRLAFLHKRKNVFGPRRDVELRLMQAAMKVNSRTRVYL